METQPFGKTGQSFPILEVLPLVRPVKMPWKAADWGNPTEWKPRQEPAGPAVWSQTLPEGGRR